MMSYFFFFNDTATTEIYTLSLHDALPIYDRPWGSRRARAAARPGRGRRRSCTPGRRSRAAASATAPAAGPSPCRRSPRSEEHTSELQSRQYLVCRLLLEKKKKILSQTTFC